jgi:uncharacterized protein DUF4129
VSGPVREGSPIVAVDETKDNRRSRLRAPSPERVLLLGIALLALLGLVAAASRAHHTPGGHPGGHRPPAAVGDYLFSIFAVVFVGAAIAIVWVVVSERAALTQRKRSQKGTYKTLALLIGFGLIASLVARFHAHILGHGSSGAGTPLVGTAAKTATLPVTGAAERAPHFELLPVIVAAAGILAVLAVVAVRSLRRKNLEQAESLELEQEFEELVEDTLTDLYAETDPRRAIIAAYARVERLFAGYGLPRDPAEAPMEYLERVLPALRASGAALRRLTRLFEWAKFSAHDVHRPMRDEAIGALVEVRDELRANRIEAAA